MGIKITDRNDPKTVTVKTNASKTMPNQAFKWWNANSKKDVADQLITTAAFLKEQQAYRYRQSGVFARLYGNIPLYGVGGQSMSRMGSGNHNLPIDRPTMNVVQSCIDTLVSRVTQSRPRPVF